MKYKHFKLTGKAKEEYLKLEDIEMKQHIRQHKGLLEERDDIESYRPGHNGGILAVKFKEGKQPDCFVKAHKDLPADEVRPHGRSKEAKPWRELFKSLRVTEDCQGKMRSMLKLPDFVLGEGVPGRFGRYSYSTTFGHVGDEVIARVPVSDEDPYENENEDLVEIKASEFQKMYEDAEDHEYDKVYTMGSLNE